MSDDLTTLELRSTATGAGRLELALVDVPVAAPGDGEIVVRVEATPINPSDLGLLLGPADMATLETGGTADRPTLSAAIPPRAMAGVKSRLDESMPVGNEGGGTVIAAGPGAEAMIGKRVGMMGGGMYTRLRKLRAADVMPLPEGASAADGASMFVNPLTALAFVETMKAEGHKAIVHTAAASNLGQMLNRICLMDGVPLICVVRSEAQAAILREQGATHIVDSSTPDFQDRLTDAIAETGATLAFDAIGGGNQAARILQAMETAASRNAATYSRYGSDTFKQVYIYGGLDLSPTVLDRWVGFSWALGGWLLTPFLVKAGRDTGARLRQRVADELTTTFASRYTKTISLAEALDSDTVRAYQRKATGEKFLIDPTL
ncbi:zinc-binding dehydrogenase [Sphingomonas sp.]|uniref:zinc-binding dehydrogenase n=1 Tax=Sphingomonas sp. TaxID=28214 RepID=UPI003AFFF9E6